MAIFSPASAGRAGGSWNSTQAAGPLASSSTTCPLPNAFEVGPDGKLYFPAMSTERDLAHRPRRRRARSRREDLGLPDSVKFDCNGFIVSTQVASGQVLRIDPRTGAKTVLADLSPGLDNCTFVGGRLFVSHILGSIHEVLGDGEVKRSVERGFNGRWG